MALQQQLRSRLQVVSVDFENDPVQAARFGKLLHAHFPIVVGSDKLFEDYSIDAPPVNVVISRAGKVLLVQEEFDRSSILKALHPEFLAMNEERAAARAAAQKPAQKTASKAVNGAAADSAGGKRTAVHRPFGDVPPDHWAATAVQMLQQRGIVRGYPTK